MHHLKSFDWNLSAPVSETYKWPVEELRHYYFNVFDLM